MRQNFLPFVWAVNRIKRDNDATKEYLKMQLSLSRGDIVCFSRFLSGQSWSSWHLDKRKEQNKQTPYLYMYKIRSWDMVREEKLSFPPGHLQLCEAEYFILEII